MDAKLQPSVYLIIHVHLPYHNDYHPPYHHDYHPPYHHDYHPPYHHDFHPHIKLVLLVIFWLFDFLLIMVLFL